MPRLRRRKILRTDYLSRCSDFTSLVPAVTIIVMVAMMFFLFVMAGMVPVTIVITVKTAMLPIIVVSGVALMVFIFRKRESAEDQRETEEKHKA